MFLKTSPPFSMEDENNWYDSLNSRKGKVFTIETLDGRVIGNAGLINLDFESRRVDMGIMIGEKDCWNKGYGTEAISLLLEFLFDELNMNRVALIADTRNHRAIRCYEKCGFQKEGIMRKARFKNGVYTDDLIMAILRDDWLKQRSVPSH